MLLLLSLLVSGCTSTHEMLQSPRSQDDVNRVLRRHPARIILRDGEIIEKAEKARLREDEVEYIGRGRQSLPIGEVSRIEVDFNRGRAIGAAAGSAPGAALMGLGTVFFFTSSDKEEWGKFAGLLYIGLGTVTLLVGGVTGDLIGGLVGEKRTYVVYQTPQEYRPDAADQ